MTDSEKRKFVSDLYPGRSWKRTVSRMGSGQVFAIWKKEQAKLEARRELEREAKQDKDDQDDIPF